MSVAYNFVASTILSVTYSVSSFNLIPPSSLSTGAVTFSSSNSLVATISGHTVTITGTGSTTLTLTRQADDNYKSSTRRMELIVTEVNTVLSNFDNMVKKLSDDNFTLIQPTSNNSLGSFFYTSSNELVAEVYGNIVKIIGIGTTVITATQESSGGFNSASITSNLIVNKIDTYLTDFNDLTYLCSNEEIRINPPLSNSLASFTYYSSNEEVALISGNNIQLIKSGTSIITATQASTDYYNSASIVCTLNVTKIAPEIFDFIIPTKTYGDVSFMLSDPATNSDGEFTFTSSDSTAVSISGRTINILKAGLVSITATQAETNKYLSKSIATLFIVNKAPATIGDFSVSEKIYGGGSFILSDPNSNSNGEFIFSSSNNTVATIYEKTVTLVGGGESIITAIQTESDNYLSAIKTTVLIVNRTTTTLSNFNIPEKKYGDGSFDLTKPTSNSDGAFIYSSSDETVVKIVGTTVSVIGAGSASITARQIETTNNLSASIVTIINVIKANPILGQLANVNKIYGDDPFNLSPPSSTSSGLFFYSTPNTEVVRIIENTVTVVGGGSVNVIVRQASTANYNSASIIFELIVNKANPTLGNLINLIKTFGDSKFNLSPPSSNSPGLFSYYISDSEIATISGSEVTIVKVGSVTITATQEATTNYLAATKICSLTINKAIPILSGFVNLTKTFGNDQFALNPTSNSNGLIYYSSSDSAVATISGNVVTIVGAGLVAITATQTATNNYLEVTNTCSLTVNQATPTLSMNNLAKIFGDDQFDLVSTSNSPGFITYSSSNSAVATIVGSAVTIVGAGSTIITVSQEATANYLAATQTCSLIVSKATPIISGFINLSKTFGDSLFNLVPSSNSTGLISFTSSNTGVASISGSDVTIVGAGTAVITLLQEATDNYIAASIPVDLIVSKANTLLSGFANLEKTFGEPKFNLPVPSSNRFGLFTYSSSNTAIATISGTEVTILGAGTARVTATQAATANYLEESIILDLIVSKATPTLSIGNITKTFGDNKFNLVSSSNSLGELTYLSSDNSVATIVGSEVTIIGVGVVTITVEQATTSNYFAATNTCSLSISKAIPTLSMNNLAKTFGDASFDLVPSSNSPGFITYSSSDSAVATIVGSAVTIVGAGSTIITVSQEATANYLAATQTSSLIVSKATPILSGFANLSKTFGDSSFNLDPSSNSTGLISFTSSNTGVASISGSEVTIIGAGTAVVTLLQAATANYLAASIPVDLIVSKANTILSDFADLLKTFGEPKFNLPVPSSNRFGSFTYSSSNTAIVTISGSEVTILGAGTARVTATQFATANYLEESIILDLIVSKATPTLSIGNITKTFGDNKFNLVPSSNSLGELTYLSSDDSIATIVGSEVTIIGVGLVTITATQTVTNNYLEATNTCSLSISKATPILSMNNLAKIFGDDQFDLVSTSNSPGSLSYSSSDSAVATIVGSAVTIVGAGSAIITVSQEATANYLAATQTSSLIVSKATPILSGFANLSKTFGGQKFTLFPPSSNSSGSFSYASSHALVASISEDEVTLVGAGTATVTATQAATANYLAASIILTLTVNKAIPIISNFVNLEKTYGDSSFSLLSSSNSSAQITYSTSNTEVATIFGNNVNIVGAGTSDITLEQAATANYVAVTIKRSLIVSKATPIINNLFNLTQTFGDSAFDLPEPSSVSSGPFTYSSSNTGVATIFGRNIIIIGAGTSNITVEQAATPNYFAATKTITLIVNKASPILGNFSNLTKTFGDSSFELSVPSSISSGQFTYFSSNTGVATIDRRNVTIIGAGTSFVTAVQEETNNYIAALITVELIVSKATPLLSRFNNLTKTYSVNNFSLVDPLSISPGQFSYSILDDSIASISGSTVTLLGVGSTTVRALQLATSNYNSALIECQLIVDKATPVLDNFNNITKMIYDNDFFLQDPTSTSPGAFSYLSSNSYVASVSGKFVTIMDGGNTTILARQVETSLYTSASITCSITILKRDTNLSNFGNLEKKFGDNDFTLAQPTSNREGGYSYLSSNPLVAIVSDNVVKIVGGGSTTITALQGESAEYAEGTITCVLTVSKINPVLSNVNVIYANGEYQIRFDSTSNGTYSYVFSDNSAVRINPNNTLSFLKSASVIVKILQNETANYFKGTYSTIIDHKKD